MAVKYLDNAGTQYLVNKIKAIDSKIPTESQITTMITTALNTYKEGIVTIVESLPQTGEEGKLYLMVDPSDSDVYIIYTWEENAFKRMGSKTFTLTVDSALSSTSTNPVQNKVVKSALDGKANSSHTHGSITNDGKLATASRVVITGTDKKIGVSTVTTTELGYLSGVTSAIQTQLDGKSATGHTHTAGDVAGLATVATSGSYNDLSDKPAINNATLTIQKNGTTVKTFTANASSNVTCNITVPTKTSDLTNDSNFVDTSNSAVASGITSAKVTAYDSHIADTDIHVTTTDKTKWNNGVSQAYVFRYSSTALVASSTNSNSLLDNTDNLKVGDKVIDSSGVLFSITAIDSVNSTFTVGSALVDLALDANVVHTSGNESIGGTKTFNDLQIISYGTQYKGARNAYILPEFAAGYSGLSITTLSFAQNLKIGNFVLDANNKPTLDTSKAYIQIATGENNGVNACILEPRNSTSSSLGTSANRWSKIYGTEYYYGSNNVEFSTKFVTTDTSQTISGAKTFSGNVSIYNSDASVDAKYLILKNQKVKRGSTTETGSQFITFHDKDSGTLVSYETSVSGSGNTQAYINVSNLDANSQRVVGGVKIIKTPTETWFIPDGDNTVSSGSSNYKWKDVQTKLINGLTPSSLGMPATTGTVDISGYITALDGTFKSYTVPANGWISIAVVGTAIAIVSSRWSDSRLRESSGNVRMLYPVLKDETLNISVIGTTLAYAKFFPCQGNI